MNENNSADIIRLPKPQKVSNLSIERALLLRRSKRKYENEPLTQSEISQLLWAAQGTVEEAGFRTAPSAGAIYPLEIYINISKVIGIRPGLYKYSNIGHELRKILDDDNKSALSRAALNQKCIEDAAVIFVIAVIFERIIRRYGERGMRYAQMEVGHVAQNLFLQAVSLKVGTVAVGAFYDDLVKKILKMPLEEQPLYLIPAGKLHSN